MQAGVIAQHVEKYDHHMNNAEIISRSKFATNAVNYCTDYSYMYKIGLYSDLDYLVVIQ